MTVRELIEALERLERFGHGEEQVQIFDPDSKAWKAVTDFAYGGIDKIVTLYSDQP